MSGGPAIAAVPLGCCPCEPRCALCPPPPAVLAPDAIRGLVHGTATRARPDQPVWVGFYGGRLPTDDELAAAEGRPISVRVRPDLLSRADVPRLQAAGVVHIELDVLTLDNAVLRGVGRRYRSAVVLEQLAGLRQAGLEVGGILAPGLPGSTFTSSVADAEQLAPRLDTARLHPVLVLRGSALREAHTDGLYTALQLGEAITVCRALLDVFEAAGVRVLRIGQQPGPDGLGHAVAGPRHPSLRELVEARRTLDALRRVLDRADLTGRVEVRCAPADVSRVRGPRNQHVRDLRAEFRLDEVRVAPDPTLDRGQYTVVAAS